MKPINPSNIMYPILGSLLGMLIGFTIFIITEQIIFLIACITIGLTSGIFLGETALNKQDRD